GVARGMSMAVVHLLEVIDVQQEQRKWPAVPLGFTKTAEKLRVERAPVEQSREPIGGREVLRLLVEARPNERFGGLERQHRQLLLGRLREPFRISRAADQRPHHALAGLE